MERLDHIFATVAARRSTAVAVEDPFREASVTYAELDGMVQSIADSLQSAGVGPGDRVGVCTPKSIASVASLLGVLRAGAAYVPVDPQAPEARSAQILDDCGVRAVLAAPDRHTGLAAAAGGGFGERQAMGFATKAGTDVVLLDGPLAERVESPPGLAYVLYTSGSTGRPKGVMHTHGSALAFVHWCAETFQPEERDRFSSHAPFHFDLSIHDIFVPLLSGATMVLISEDEGKQPTTLARRVAEDAITVWYSTPSILRLMVEFGRMEPSAYERLRIVHFAGEVFPVKHLRALKAVWPEPDYYNLYGPTETNVCTYHAIPRAVPEDRDDPFPIGVACSGDSCRVTDADGADVKAGDEGELLVSGPSVMAGYWNLPDLNQEAFLVGDDGAKWYRTGDIVRDLGDGCYDFLGRRDRMVKRRGYRVELGEIEAALYQHPDVSEAAVVAIHSDGSVRIEAFLTSVGETKLTLLRMKQYCAGKLPLYMIPDGFRMLDGELPKTSTDKIDYQRLKELTA